MTATASGPRAGKSGPSSGAGGRGTIELSRSRVVAALSTYFNFVALSVALLVACLPVVTVPAALHAANVALERWRGDGEERVVREFLGTLRARDSLSATLTVGVPLLVAGTAGEEVHYFWRVGPGVGWLCLGFGAAALFTTLISLGYVLLMGARYPSLPAAELWTFSVRLALANILLTGPLFLLEMAIAVSLGLLDPALLLIGLPLALLAMLRVTADLGARRCGYPRAGQPARRRARSTTSSTWCEAEAAPGGRGRLS
jgi:hypothetical protein